MKIRERVIEEFTNQFENSGLLRKKNYIESNIIDNQIFCNIPPCHSQH